MAIEKLCIRARPVASSVRVSVARTWQRPASTDSTTTATPPVSSPKAAQTSDADVAVTGLASAPSIDRVAAFDPLKRSRRRRLILSPKKSFNNYWAPRYFRGPLHPVQPPPPSDPTSREFRAGPFSLPRLEQTYNATLSHDLMAIFYEHVPPGTPKAPPKQRLREWGDASPYYKNRPLRPPRGDPTGQLGLLRKQVNWWNLPELERITVSAVIPEGASSSPHVHAAGMVVQAITGARATITKARRSTNQNSSFRGKGWMQKKGKPISATVELRGEEMWHFLSMLTAVVMPKIKEFTGVRGRSGDDNGNLQIGIAPDLVGGWPEVAINYDAYPPDMIPGVGITLHSSARSDRDMRLLFAGLGVPFKGNHRTRGP